MPFKLPDLKILIRGAGEMASGCACLLHRSGFFRILMTEIERPRAVRRMVSFCEAVYEARWTVEDVTAERIDHVEAAQDLWEKRLIPVLVDPEASSRKVLKPDVLLDAVLAKRNLGTDIQDTPLVIALGPGFCAGKDAHCVIETSRGHNLARLISQGSASPNTGVPAEIGGHSVLRVLRSPADGVFQSDSLIGMQVTEGQVLGHVSGEPVRSGLKGVLRGLIRPGTPVTLNFKLGTSTPAMPRHTARLFQKRPEPLEGACWKQCSGPSTLSSKLQQEDLPVQWSVALHPPRENASSDSDVIADDKPSI